jgi:tripartite-type tricarboxylate transporter receptor subunit TctC
LLSKNLNLLFKGHKLMLHNQDTSPKFKSFSLNYFTANAWRICLTAILAVIAGLCIPTSQAQAQAYPNKPIRMVVGYAAGGSTDILARTLGQKLSEALGTSVIIENRPGASGTIGSDFVAKAPPDGYTILMGEVGSLAMAPGLFPKLPYDPARDFTVISVAARSPLLLTVRSDSPLKSLNDLLAKARSTPAGLNYATSGAGGPNHLASELFGIQAKIKTTHVPYKGSAPATLSIASGETDFGLLTAVTINALLQADKVKVLAVASDQRLTAMPTVPTMSEAGLPGFESDVWFMLVAPANTPKPIVDRLNTELAKILRDTATQEKLTQMTAIPVGNTPQAATAFLKSEITKWTRVSKSAGITLE